MENNSNQKILKKFKNQLKNSNTRSYLFELNYAFFNTLTIKCNSSTTSVSFLGYFSFKTQHLNRTVAFISIIGDCFHGQTIQ